MEITEFLAIIGAIISIVLGLGIIATIKYIFRRSSRSYLIEKMYQKLIKYFNENITGSSIVIKKLPKKIKIDIADKSKELKLKPGSREIKLSTVNESFVDVFFPELSYDTLIERILHDAIEILLPFKYILKAEVYKSLLSYYIEKILSDIKGVPSGAVVNLKEAYPSGRYKALDFSEVERIKENLFLCDEAEDVSILDHIIIPMLLIIQNIVKDKDFESFLNLIEDLDIFLRYLTKGKILILSTERIHKGKSNYMKCIKKLNNLLSRFDRSKYCGLLVYVKCEDNAYPYILFREELNKLLSKIGIYSSYEFKGRFPIAGNKKVTHTYLLYMWECVVESSP